jgi:hypothetical protein
MATLSLTGLSAELRLKIYQHLVDDYLGHGAPKDMPGIYLSSHEAHNELEAALPVLYATALAEYGCKLQSRVVYHTIHLLILSTGLQRR